MRHDPKAIKAFYMQVNDDSRTVAAMEMLAPGIGEIIGDSQGITRNYGAGLELRRQFTRQ